MTAITSLDLNEQNQVKINFVIRQLLERAGASRNILQIQQANTSTASTTVGVTFATTAVTKAITPASTSSQVLVVVSGNAVSATINAQAIVKLRRNGTDLPPVILAGTDAGTAISAGSAIYLDSPATNSAVTYDTQVASDTVGATAVFPYAINGGTGTIILMEFAPA